MNMRNYDQPKYLFIYFLCGFQTARLNILNYIGGLAYLRYMAHLTLLMKAQL